MGEVWIVDQSAGDDQCRDRQKRDHRQNYPGAALALVDEVFEGDVAFSEGFSPLLEDTSITVGAPVLSAEGEVIAAVLCRPTIVATCRLPCGRDFRLWESAWLWL